MKKMPVTLRTPRKTSVLTSYSTCHRVKFVEMNALTIALLYQLLTIARNEMRQLLEAIKNDISTTFSTPKLEA